MIIHLNFLTRPFKYFSLLARSISCGVNSDNVIGVSSVILIVGRKISDLKR